jgi:hypothetical protein
VVSSGSRELLRSIRTRAPGTCLRRLGSCMGVDHERDNEESLLRLRKGRVLCSSPLMLCEALVLKKLKIRRSTSYHLPSESRSNLGVSQSIRHGDTSNGIQVKLRSPTVGGIMRFFWSQQPRISTRNCFLCRQAGITTRDSFYQTPRASNFGN